jgi:hypothetical protein
LKLKRFHFSLRNYAGKEGAKLIRSRARADGRARPTLTVNSQLAFQ